jgi:hypothetical protein
MEYIKMGLIIILFSILFAEILKSILIKIRYKQDKKSVMEEIRQECIAEAKKQKEMYETQLVWADDLKADKKLIKDLKDKDWKYIQIYLNMIKLLERK